VEGRSTTRPSMTAAEEGEESNRMTIRRGRVRRERYDEMLLKPLGMEDMVQRGGGGDFGGGVRWGVEFERSRLWHSELMVF
jgi:hypothetical protein